jgi:hypothetical protein
MRDDYQPISVLFRAPIQVQEITIRRIDTLTPRRDERNLPIHRGIDRLQVRTTKE